MASSFEEIFENEVSLDEDPSELYGIRDGILFVIDATPPMFEIDPHEGVSYFLQCIRQYKEILKQKLVWNRQDWMGLVLFGTEKGDVDSETKNVLTLQKLNLVSMDNLKEIIKIDEGGKWEYYRDIASSTAYPLHDVLWHAARIFSAVDITMPTRRVILFTCQDDPPMTNSNEKHRIRVKASNYSEIRTQLCIIGLGENWNHDLFYKDLEILSEKIDADDYKRTSIKDLLHEVKLPSRNMATLPWKVGGDVIIDVAVRNLSVKRQYLKKEWISKETNIPLTSHSYMKLASDSPNEEEGDDEENERLPEPVLETQVQKYQTFGGKRICFTIAEMRSLSGTRDPGIDLICIKPIYYHPLYHFGAPYFITPGKSNRKDNRLLFGAIVDKCDSKNLMIICAVTLRKRSSPKLYTMIPNSSNGGFYLYRIPFKVPRIVEMQKLIKDSLDKYHEMFDEEEECTSSEPPTKKVKKSSEADAIPDSFNEEEIRKIIAQGKINKATVPQLKSMLKIFGSKTSGKKEELIRRLKEVV
ncbi:X-ray repair cross-complementing protein 6-like isoform X2 [Colletes gigas]|uniref:X-ray repair cross-complementing protein 6-like isoform X2 n=1 Tax=Colletes gigas TaxID=935657 RepID=UPI001C9AE4A3|nr:X-ray repair cross-complementing protein 6-like isoform X2 [Colletes gigas]